LTARFPDSPGGAIQMPVVEEANGVNTNGVKANGLEAIAS
jgi:hypothetical protein